MNGAVLALFLIAVVAIFVLKRLKGSSSDGEGNFPYVLGTGLFSPAERSFLGVLDQAVGSDFRVFGKVRVADVVSVAKGTPKALWQRAFNKISAKHFDYVLCRPTDLKPVCVIELNDQSHAQDSRKGRDLFLEGVCATAGIPLIFFAAKRSYTLSEVCDQIAAAMGNQGAVVSVVTPSPVEASNLNVQTARSAGEVHPDDVTSPQCPRCSGPMIRRKAKSGANVGQEFWGCTKFPACRGVVLS